MNSVALVNLRLFRLSVFLGDLIFCIFQWIYPFHVLPIFMGINLFMKFLYYYFSSCGFFSDLISSIPDNAKYVFFFLAKSNQKFVYFIIFLNNWLLVLIILKIFIAFLFSIFLFYALRFIIYCFLFYFVSIYSSFSGLVKLVAQSCPTLWNPMDCICQAPLSMGFPRQEY